MRKMGLDKITGYLYVGDQKFEYDANGIKDITEEVGLIERIKLFILRKRRISIRTSNNYWIDLTVSKTVRDILLYETNDDFLCE